MPLSVKGPKFLTDPGQRSLVVDRHQLAHHGRKLHGHVVHLIAAHHFEHAFQSIIRLALAQHRFTEDVDVETDPIASASAKVVTE